MSASYTFKADPALHDAIQNLMKSDGLSRSQAIRAVLTMGFANVDKLDIEWRKVAFNEGRFEGLNATRDVFKSMMASSMRNLD